MLVSVVVFYDCDCLDNVDVDIWVLSAHFGGKVHWLCGELSSQTPEIG